jgi:hypothetical protein
MAKRYTVSDGKLTLTLGEAVEGGYIVTSSMDHELITEADSISEAFEMARDALAALRGARAQLVRDLMKVRRNLIGTSETSSVRRK